VAATAAMWMGAFIMHFLAGDDCHGTSQSQAALTAYTTGNKKPRDRKKIGRCQSCIASFASIKTQFSLSRMNQVPWLQLVVVIPTPRPLEFRERVRHFDLPDCGPKWGISQCGCKLAELLQSFARARSLLRCITWKIAYPWAVVEKEERRKKIH
jgi:hypothetical protein